MCSMDSKLLHLMEEFVLKEVDYSQQHGYSGRAKRYMRRKLTNELTSFLENIESVSESEGEIDDENDIVSNENNTSDENTFDKMIHRDYKSIHNKIDFCFGMAYVMFLASLYASIAHIIFSYKHVHVSGQYLNNSISHESCL